MTTKLLIPQQLQGLLDDINATSLDLGEIKIDKHPLVSQDLERYIQIKKISIDLNLPRTYIWYEQVLKDSEGKTLLANLPTPAWILSENETSTLRDENFQRIEVPVIDEETGENILEEDGSPKKSCVHLSSHKYLLWLLKNNKAGFIQLLEIYLQEFVEKNQAELDKLA